jgi:hypothetical protein
MIVREDGSKGQRLKNQMEKLKQTLRKIKEWISDLALTPPVPVPVPVDNRNGRRPPCR